MYICDYKVLQSGRSGPTLLANSCGMLIPLGYLRLQQRVWSYMYSTRRTQSHFLFFLACCRSTYLQRKPRHDIVIVVGYDKVQLA